MENSLEALHMALAALFFILSLALIFAVNASYDKMADYMYDNCGERIVSGI